MRIIISRRPPPQMAMLDSYGSYAGGKLSAVAASKNFNAIYEAPADPTPGLIPEAPPAEPRVPASEQNEGGDVEEKQAELL